MGVRNFDPVDFSCDAKNILSGIDVHDRDISVKNLADPRFAKYAAYRELDRARLGIDDKFVAVLKTKTLRKCFCNRHRILSVSECEGVFYDKTALIDPVVIENQIARGVEAEDKYLLAIAEWGRGDGFGHRLGDLHAGCRADDVENVLRKARLARDHLESSLSGKLFDGVVERIDQRFIGGFNRKKKRKAARQARGPERQPQRV